MWKCGVAKVATGVYMYICRIHGIREVNRGNLRSGSMPVLSRTKHSFGSFLLNPNYYIVLILYYVTHRTLRLIDIRNVKLVYTLLMECGKRARFRSRLDLQIHHMSFYLRKLDVCP